MCLALYLGTHCTLELQEGPLFSVRPVAQAGSAVLSFLKTRNVYHLGSHTGCSCGFPSVRAEDPIEYYEGMLEDRAEPMSDRASVRELLALLGQVLSEEGTCLLYPVWNGDESVSPKGVIHRQLSQLSEETFVLTELFVYQIHSDSCGVSDCR